MHRESLLLVLGILIVFTPYFGFPYGWLMFVLPVLGLLVLAIGLSLHLKRRMREKHVPATPHDETSSAL